MIIKKKERIGIAWILCILLIFVSQRSVYGQETKADAAFKDGVRAFRQKDYNVAATLFKTARAAGLKTEALGYNLGVSHYKSGQYTDALKEFESLKSSKKMSAVAHYNIGLIKLRQNEPASAKTHFQIAYDSARNEKLKELARIQLRPDEPAADNPLLTGYLSIAGGYDDNITLGIENEIQSSKIDDRFVELLAAASARITGKSENGFQLNAGGYALRYQDADEYNFSSIGINPEFDYKIGEWQTETGLDLNLIHFGDRLFEMTAGAGVKGSRYIYRNLSMRLQYKITKIEAETDFEYLTGFQHQLGAGIFGQVFGTNGNAGYRFELNDRKDPTYPSRHELLISASRDFDSNWSSRLDGSFRASNYDHSSRNDRRLRLGFKISRRILWDWKLFGKYNFTRNFSNSDQYEYISNVVAFGLERIFEFNRNH